MVFQKCFRFAPSLLWMAIILGACMPYQEEVLTDITTDARDSIFQRINTFQNDQLTDSLYNYFRHRNPAYRYTAALAFASIRNASAVDSLATLLTDPIDGVRAAAAYALGQIGEPSAEPLLIGAFDQYDTLGHYNRANRAILEAVGKCGNQKSLDLLATISTYQVTDTALLEGQAWGVYRFGLRDIVSGQGTSRMMTLVLNKEYPVSVRFIAANYLSRINGIDIQQWDEPMARLLFREEDPRLRMALAIALGKAGTRIAFDALVNQYKLEQDYRVKCNILRALGNFDYAMVSEMIFRELKSPNHHISLRAAQYFLDNGQPADGGVYWQMARDTMHWQTQLTMYAAALRQIQISGFEYLDGLNYQIRKRFREAENPFEKIAALQALAQYPWNFRYIPREGFQAEHGIVRAAAVRALQTIADNSVNIPGMETRNTTNELAYIFRQAIESGDPSLMEAAAEALTSTRRSYAASFDTLAFLQEAINKIDTNENLFTARALRQAYQHLSGEEPPPTVDRHLPIEWTALGEKNLEPMALIRTTKGVIRVRMFPRYAPATVAHFINLAREGYYQNKFFYRVVPNFVIQGAESLDYDPVSYTIRSELPPLHYDEAGLIGMASMGNHTESTQFFITHSPAPHLDGNYTIFGKVESGLDVVHQIEIGDMIHEIVIQ